MKYLAVTPWMVRDFRDACLGSCRLDSVLEIDNHQVNRGSQRSYNLGLDEMRRIDADWLVMLQPSIRFGDAGGRDFIAALEARPDHAVVTATGVYGWHLIAFSRETVELAGRWDENLHPYGADDLDYAVRIHKSQPDGIWSTVDVEVGDTMMAHSIKLAGVVTDAERQLVYLESKWGHRFAGQPFEEFNDLAFGDLPIGYWPPPSSPPIDPDALAMVANGRWDQPAPLSEPLPVLRSFA